MTYFLVIMRSSCAHGLIHGVIFILPCPIRGSVKRSLDLDFLDLLVIQDPMKGY